MSITDLHQRRGILLTVAGLQTRYYLGVKPVEAYCPGTGAPYTDVEALESVLEWSESVKHYGGIGEYGSVMLALSTQGEDGGPNDPGNVLCRVGPSGADWRGVLNATLDPGVTTIYLSEDAPEYLAGEIIHLGGESIKVGSVSGSTLVGCTRAVASTVGQRHLVEPGTAGYPMLTMPLTHFRGRFAWISITDGDPSAYKEVYWGQIEDSPRVEAGGTVALSLSHVLTALSEEIPSAGEEVGLVEGWHYFAAGAGDTWSFAVKAPVDCIELEPITGVSGAVLEAPDALSTGPLACMTDPTLPTNHPRSPRIAPRSSLAYAPRTQDRVTAFDDSPAAYVCSSPLMGTWSIGQTPAYLGGQELVTVTIPSGLQPFPQALTSALATRCQSGSASGLSGAWTDCALVLGDAPALIFSPTTRRWGGQRPTMREPLEVEVRWAGQTDQIVGESVRSGHVATMTRAYDWSSGSPSLPPVGSELYAPIQPVSQDHLSPFGLNRYARLTTIPVVVAPSWYTRGEPYLLVTPTMGGTSPVNFPLDGSHIAVVELWSAQDDSRRYHVRIVDALTVALGGAQVAYRLTIHIDDRDKLPTVTGPLRLRQVAQMRVSTWRTYASALLVSPGPGGELPVGVGLPLQRVLLSLNSENGDLGPIGGGQGGGDDLDTGELLGSFCTASLQAMVTRHGPEGYLVVGLVPMASGSTEVVLTQDHILATPEGPQASVDDQTVNQLAITALVPAQDPPETITINDRDAQLRVGAVESLDLTLPLASGADPEALVPLASRIFALASSPTATLTLPVPVGVALGLSLGARVSSPWGSGVVTSRALDPMGHQASVTLHLRAGAAGWNSEADPGPELAHFPAFIT